MLLWLAIVLKLFVFNTFNFFLLQVSFEMIIKGVECARRIFDEVALELSKLKSSEFFSSWGLNGFCSVPEHKRVIALCSSKVVTKLLSTHRGREIQEEVIIKGGHVNIRSQVKISNPNFTIKTVTMTKIGNGWNHVFFRYKNYLKKYVVEYTKMVLLKIRQSHSILVGLKRNIWVAKALNLSWNALLQRSLCQVYFIEI